MQVQIFFKNKARMLKFGLIVRLWNRFFAKKGEGVGEVLQEHKYRPNIESPMLYL